jgi:hypothetical protein
MTIALDTPEQINMWVLLSRRAQLKMHLAGYPVKGLVAWCKRNLDMTEGGKPIRTAKDAVVPLEYLISQHGGQVDWKVVNMHVMRRLNDEVFQDLGIWDSPEEIQEGSPMHQMYEAGSLEIVLTTQETRKPTGELFTTA